MSGPRTATSSIGLKGQMQHGLQETCTRTRSGTDCSLLYAFAAGGFPMMPKFRYLAISKSSYTYYTSPVKQLRSNETNRILLFRTHKICSSPQQQCSSPLFHLTYFPLLVSSWSQVPNTSAAQGAKERSASSSAVAVRSPWLSSPGNSLGARRNSLLHAVAVRPIEEG